MARRIERAYEQAIENRELLKAALDAIPNVDSSMVDAMLPYIPDIDFDDSKSLYGQNGIFRSRADYERNLRYLDRLNRAAETEWSGRGTSTFEGVTQTQLTSFYVDDSSNYQSEFMRREQSLAERSRNRETIARLKSMGIDMVKVPVYKSFDAETGEVSVMYNESRHPVMRYVPKTPDMARRYFYARQKQQGLDIVQPDIPEGGIYVQYGDIVSVEPTPNKRLSRSSFTRFLSRDEYRADSTELYFRNMKAIIDQTLPDKVAGKFDDVFNQIFKESPDRMYEIYRMIDADAGDDIASLDFFYLENATKISARLNQIYQVFRNRVVPELSSNVEMEDIATADEWEEIIGENPVLKSGQSIRNLYRENKSEDRYSYNLKLLKAIREGY